MELTDVLNASIASKIRRVLDTITDEFKDMFITRGFDEGLSRCRQLGINDVYFDLNAVYVDDPSDTLFGIFDSPAYLLTNVEVLIYAKSHKGQHFKFSLEYTSDVHPRMMCMVPTREEFASGWPADKPLGEAAIMLFLEKEFAQYISEHQLGCNSLKSNLLNINLTKEPHKKHIDQIVVYPID